MSGVVVVGAGRGSAELVDFLGDCGVTDIVVVDDRHPSCADVAGAPVVGTLDDVAGLVAAGRRVISGIANSKTRGVRLRIVEKLALEAQVWTSCVHLRAHVSRRARVGSGVVVYPGVVVATDAVVDDHAVVYANAVVHHDSVVGRGAIVCAGVLLAGGVTVGAGAYLGVGAVVRDGVSIGEGALVGMGAVVTKDIAAGAIVKGVPAR